MIATTSDAAPCPPASQVIPYRIHSADNPRPQREVAVQASAEELRQLARDGFLIRERLFTGQELKGLRQGVDEVVGEEMARTGTTGAGHGGFGGVFVRQLMDRHPAFHVFLGCAPLISVARAMLGPQVWIRDTVARVTHPGQPRQDTEWHFHQRVVPQPMPPWFCFPHILDALVYLDDLDEATGPLCVVPGSHLRLDADLPAGDYSVHPDQRVLQLPSGSVALVHGNLWHRAMPTLAHGRRRRLVIVGFAPLWLRSPPQGRVSEDGLLARRLRQADPETSELLGASGYY